MRTKYIAYIVCVIIFVLKFNKKHIITILLKLKRINNKVIESGRDIKEILKFSVAVLNIALSFLFCVLFFNNTLLTSANLEKL